MLMTIENELIIVCSFYPWSEPPCTGFCLCSSKERPGVACYCLYASLEMLCLSFLQCNPPISSSTELVSQPVPFWIQIFVFLRQGPGKRHFTFLKQKTHLNTVFAVK